MKRNLKWSGLALGFLLFLSVIAFSYRHYSVKFNREAEYSSGYAEGCKRAKTDLETGNARIYVCGKRQLYKDLDLQTGLTLHAIAGCIVSEYDRGLAGGYNDTIVQYIRQSGPPANSRIKWNAEILGPVNYLAGSDRDDITTMETNSEPIPDPSGEFSLRLFIEHRVFAGKEFLFPRLALRQGDSDPRTIKFPGGDIQNPQPVEMTWGPVGSDTAFIRYRWRYKNVEAAVAVLDLHTGLWLNCERISQDPLIGRSRFPNPLAQNPSRDIFIFSEFSRSWHECRHSRCVGNPRMP
jgi:hypothetical protein